MKNISLTGMIVDSNGPQGTGGCGSGNGGKGGLEFVKRKKPEWLRARLPGGKGFVEMRDLVSRYKLNTVCESAMCPNLGECWDRGTATMMILGDVCTRACRFCNVKTGRPPEYDLDEPRRVGEAAALMRLKHLVLTSVDRDELPDGGAEIWAETIREIRRLSPNTQVEVLIPDFNGDWDALQIVLDERPDILAHNMETVERLYSAVRPQARYAQSIELLRRAKLQGLTVKTGIMVGIGEREEEIREMVQELTDKIEVKGISVDDPERNVDRHWIAPNPNRNLPEEWREKASDPARITGESKREVEGRLRRGGYLIDHEKPFWQHHGPETPADATPQIEAVSYPAKTYPGAHETLDILTIGQYLQPTRNHLPINRWVTPAEFVAYKQMSEEIGVRHCESGPLVRSSYHADEQVLKMEGRETVSPRKE